METITYKLEHFEGPLDLLLAMIEKHKIDIYDIPIAQITQQYLEYVEKMHTQDPERTSEFLLMAATLLDIKARMLLPEEKKSEGNEEEEDPRSELVQRLLEYKRYKLLSKELMRMEEETGSRFFKEETLPEDVKKYRPLLDLDALLSGITPELLKKTFSQAMKRCEARKDVVRSSFNTVQKDPVSLEEKIRDVTAFAREHGRFSFWALMDREEDRMDIIMTFLAVLELMHAGLLTLWQEENFSEIFLESSGRQCGQEKET